jgi:hypothetical protein
MRGGRLSAALGRLDGILASAVRVAREEGRRPAGDDPYRGLYVGDAEVGDLLRRAPGAPRLWIGDEGEGAWGRLPDDDPAVSLQQIFDLSGFDLDAVTVGLAVEIDLKYERLFAWLQDDATRHRPTVSLVLDLLCRSGSERLERRRAFADDAPLVAHGLVHLVADEGPTAPRLAHSIRIDEAVVRHLLGEEAADARLGQFCTWHAPALDLRRLPLAAATTARLAAVLDSVRRRGTRLALHLRGPAGAGQREVAEVMAHALDAPLLVADLARLPREGAAAESALRLLGLEAALRGAVVYAGGVEAVAANGRLDVELALPGLLSSRAHVVVDAGRHRWPELEAANAAVAIDLGEPDLGARRAWWRDRLDAAGVPPPSVDVDSLAGRFRLNLDAIAEAVRAASREATDEGLSAPSTDALMARARAVSSRDLQALATAIAPARTFHDLVLPAETIAQLRELCDRVARRARVLDRWGFADKLSGGIGTNALFAGPPGTGKTLAAEVVANALGLNLYRIELAAVVSKYIGETEKNLARIFQAAERSNAVLLFDEADALFGKRSVVRDAHDRYANIEISYLLQRMEQHEGVTILATNLAQNMDEAFVRRLAFTVCFPFPDEALRRRLWAGVWPTATPLAADVDPAWLARRFKLSGGSIKNVALAAAHLVDDGEAEVTLDHVLRAVRREYQKMGRALSDDELGRERAPFRLEAAS